MKCQSCGNETRLNWGDAYTILCEACCSSSSGKELVKSNQPVNLTAPQSIEERPIKPMEFFSFEGRIKRSTYWPTIISLFLVVAGVTFGIQLGIAASTNQAFSNSFVMLDIVFTILVTWVLFATYVKRCHDINRSGWIVLTALIPFINLLVLLYLGFASGTAGVNKYGEEPQ